MLCHNLVRTGNNTSDDVGWFRKEIYVEADQNARCRYYVVIVVALEGALCGAGLPFVHQIDAVGTFGECGGGKFGGDA